MVQALSHMEAHDNYFFEGRNARSNLIFGKKALRIWLI